MKNIEPEIPDIEAKCKHCGAVGMADEVTTTSNGHPRIKRTCPCCGNWTNAAIKMDLEALEGFVYPIGKHKGLTLAQLYNDHFDYLTWVSQNVVGGKTGRLGDRVRQFLELKKQALLAERRD